MSPDSLQAVADEGRILPSVRSLAKAAKDTGYTSVSAWLRKCTPKEISILGSSGPKTLMPLYREPALGKMEGSLLTLSREDLENLPAEESGLYSFRIAASILAKTAAVAEESDRLGQVAAQDMLNVLIFLEAVRRKAKSLHFDGGDINLDASLYSEMISRRIRLTSEYEDHPEAKEVLRNIRKCLDNMQIMTRCKSRKEYLPPSLADELGVPIDFFVSPEKYSGNQFHVNPMNAPANLSLAELGRRTMESPEDHELRIIVIPQSDHSPLATELRDRYPNDPSVVEDPKFASYVRILSLDEVEEFARDPSRFLKDLIDKKDVPVLREEVAPSKVEERASTGQGPITSSSNEKPKGWVAKLKAAWAALR